jgi:hypothetical protein
MCFANGTRRSRRRGCFIAAAVFIGGLLIASPAAAQSVTPASLPDLANPCPNLDSGLIAGGGGANNIVILRNATGGDLQVRGSVQLNHIPGPTVSPVNCGAAFNGAPGPLDPPSSEVIYVGCQGLAVALQIDLISKTATQITPRNIANAQNVRCHGCAAVAIAMQYVL